MVAAAASTCIVISGMADFAIKCDHVDIVGYLCLEVWYGGHEGLHLSNHGLVLLGRQNNVVEVLVEFLVGDLVCGFGGG